MREDIYRLIKSYIDQNVWDGEDRSGCKGDFASFDPDDLQILVEEVFEYIGESGYALVPVNSMMKVDRSSDFSVTAVFTSCRTASEFQKALNPAEDLP